MTGGTTARSVVAGSRSARTVLSTAIIVAPVAANDVPDGLVASIRTRRTDPTTLFIPPWELLFNAMSGSHKRSFADELRRDAVSLDRATHRYFGVSALMFRTVKFLFYIATLAFSGYLIELAGIEPLLAMSFAALLITGPEGLEAYLVRQGVLEDRNND